MSDFITRAILAGTGLAIIAGPLGSIMVWRRMANFGDTLAHSTLLGLCFSLLLNLNMYVGVTMICMMVSGGLMLFARRRWIAHDSVLSILAYTSLAVGLIMATQISGVRINLLSYLYGDILSVNQNDLLWIYGTGLFVIILLLSTWRSILSMIVHPDLATVEGVAIRRTEAIMVLLMAIVFSVAIKIIGILLMTALFIIPAGAARFLSRTPEQMAMLSSLVGAGSVCAGIGVSYYSDWPAGPSIVIVAFGVFLLSAVGRRLISG